jgi:hypothetical protein
MARMGPVEARFRAALELRELMIAMRRQRLVREYPAEPKERIERRLREWVLGADADRRAPAASS